MELKKDKTITDNMQLSKTAENTCAIGKKCVVLFAFGFIRFC